MDNPVSRWINNTFDAAEKVDRNANKLQASGSVVKNLSGKKNLSPNEKEALDSAKKSLAEARKEHPSDRGQFFGALLQNRSYDEQGKIKGTQPNHHVTDSKNHTKPASKMESAKRPEVGTDAEAKKKYGSKSWNNGYTN